MARSVAQQRVENEWSFIAFGSRRRGIGPVARIEDAGLGGALGLGIGGAACDDAFAAFGGKSRPPLRPQPPSASAVTLSRMMAHPDDDGR